MNQSEHHKTITFKDEYRKFEIDYNERYLFEFYD